jgi:ABC-type transport system involved in cytochrome c biogenesis permease subunit
MAFALPVPETVWLWSGVLGYTGSAVAAWSGVTVRRNCDAIVLTLLSAGALMFAIAIAERWLQVGHGPFLNMFEILLSNLFSLGLIYALVFWRVPLVRPGALVALPVLLILGVWLLAVPSGSGLLPPTYDTILLWVHVGVGKVFLGFCLVATGLAGILLMKQLAVSRRVLGSLPDEALLDAMAWRIMMLAFVFHSLMLIAGAVWAQDAWGRYWDWDPLETWAFLTWLALAASLHARVTWKLPLWVGWLLILFVFVLAFLTFFGVPFLSVAPHKGMI